MPERFSVISMTCSVLLYFWMLLAITLSFAFYLPVVLWGDVHPMIVKLIVSKTYKKYPEGILLIKSKQKKNCGEIGIYGLKYVKRLT